MARLSTLRNIGQIGEEWLNEVGIHTIDDLRTVGVVEAYRRIKIAFPDRVSLNALYAMEAVCSILTGVLYPTNAKQNYVYK